MTTDSCTYTYYMPMPDGSGRIVDEVYPALFNFLKKLGIKSANQAITYTLATSSSYVVYGVNSITINSNNGYIAQNYPCTGFTIEDVKIDSEPEVKRKGFSKEEKREWRNQWKRPQNTGRKR